MAYGDGAGRGRSLPRRDVHFALENDGWNCTLGCEIHIWASSGARRSVPLSVRSPGNPRARHLTREHVCQRYVLAG